MKYTLSHQGALKAALVLALAANVSWKPLVNTFSEDYASNGETIGAKPAAAPAAQPAADAAPADGKGAETKPEPHPQPHPAAKAEPPKSDPKKHETPIRQETQKFCGVEYTVTFDEREVNGKPQTYIILQKVGSAQTQFALVRQASFEALMNSRYKLDQEIRDDVATKEKACQQQDKEQARIDRRSENRTPERPEDRSAQRQTEAERSRIAQDVENCRIKPITHEQMRDSERVSCLIDRLERIKTEQQNETRAANDVMGKIERLLNEKGQLRTMLKAGLVSRDESKVADATAHADRAIAAIESLADRYDLESYVNTRLQKVKGSLQALKDGGELMSAVRENESEVKELRKDMRHAMDELYRNPTSRSAQAEVSDLRRYHNELTSRIRENLSSPWSAFQTDIRNGWLSQEDSRVFQTPYSQLFTDLTMISDPCISSLAPSIVRCLSTGTGAGVGINGNAGLTGLAPMAPTDWSQFRTGAQRGQPGTLGPAIMMNTTPTSNLILGNQGLSFAPNAMSPTRTMQFSNSALPTGSPMMINQTRTPMAASSTGVNASTLRYSGRY